MNVAIITEGFQSTGYGHLTRCLALYQAFEERGIQTAFIANCDESGNELNNLTKVSSADCFQVRSISEQRFVKQIGLVQNNKLDQLREGLSKVFSIGI